MSTAAEIEYFGEPHTFNHIGTTIAKHKHDSLCVDVPMPQQTEEHLADLFTCVRAKHGFDIEDNLFPFPVTVNEMTGQAH